jgi:hypothetical protein
MKTRILVLAGLSLFLAVSAASAQTGTWTAVGSTGTVDPTQVGLFGVFGGTRLGFNPSGGSNAGTLTVRFNVTNTYGGGLSDGMPWTTLEVGAVNASAFDIVAATLYRVDRCTGVRTAICTATNSTPSSTGSCVSCTFPSGTVVNFGGGSVYYVEATITRTTGTGNPQLSTLRIR